MTGHVAIKNLFEELNGSVSELISDRKIKNCDYLLKNRYVCGII